jgi:hypothetical protein
MSNISHLIDDQIMHIIDIEEERPKQLTKMISLGDEINKISLKNFPDYLRYRIFFFKFLHYVLLFVAVGLIFFKRIREYEDIKEIERIPGANEKFVYYFITGIIYVKYNLEVVNFLCFLSFVINLHEQRKRTFVFKVVSEMFIMLLILLKVIVYLFEIYKEVPYFSSITKYNIMGEMLLWTFHLIIVILYVQIRTKFQESRLWRKIFRVYYLEKKLKIGHQ